MLAQRTKFEKHPWGGVIKVQVSDQARWEERFNHLNPKWETHDYDTESYLRQLSDLRQSIALPEGRFMKHQVKISTEMFSSIESFAANRLQLQFPPHNKQA